MLIAGQSMKPSTRLRRATQAVLAFGSLFLLQAHARILKCAPEQLRKALAMELAQMTDVIVSSRSVLNTSASTITKDACGKCGSKNVL